MIETVLLDYFEYAENEGKQVIYLFIKLICICASLLSKANKCSSTMSKLVVFGMNQNK